MDTGEPAKFRKWFDGNNMSLTNKSPAHQAVYICVIILHNINLLLSIISFTFGIISWIMLTKWRQFKHYVFMNLIVATTINMIGFNLCAHYKFPNIGVALLLLVPRVIMSHWLLVTTAMYYWELAKVYDEIERRYLKANLFCWVVPFLEVLIVCAIEEYLEIMVVEIFNYAINMIILVVVFILYVVVLRYIIKLTVTERGTRRDVFKKILMASASSITSGLSSLLPILVMELIHSDMVLYNIALIMCNVTIIVGHIAFLSLKQHRVLWSEYRNRQRAVNEVYVN